MEKFRCGDEIVEAVEFMGRHSNFFAQHGIDIIRHTCLLRITEDDIRPLEYDDWIVRFPGGMVGVVSGEVFDRIFIKQDQGK